VPLVLHLADHAEALRQLIAGFGLDLNDPGELEMANVLAMIFLQLALTVICSGQDDLRLLVDILKGAGFLGEEGAQTMAGPGPKGGLGNFTAKLDFGNGKLYNGSMSGGVASIAELNPIRYRGYYYDVETEFYFLQTRYYNPEWGRFLNADCYFIAGNDMLNGSNMYAYCNNNPVMYVDPTGKESLAQTLAKGIVFGAIIQIIGDLFEKIWKGEAYLKFRSFLSDTLVLINNGGMDFPQFVEDGVNVINSLVKIVSRDDLAKAGWIGAGIGTLLGGLGIFLLPEITIAAVLGLLGLGFLEGGLGGILFGLFT